MDILLESDFTKDLDVLLIFRRIGFYTGFEAKNGGLRTSLEQEGAKRQAPWRLGDRLNGVLYYNRKIN